jgi:hypothetical protein
MHAAKLPEFIGLAYEAKRLHRLMHLFTDRVGIPVFREVVLVF